jgi:hypothetical protein
MPRMVSSTGRGSFSFPASSNSGSGNTGWTTFVATAPSGSGSSFAGAGTRIIYVSSSTGNDTTGNGTQATPYATIGKGSSFIRNGSPDWLLLKCGDTFTNDNYGNINFSGPGMTVSPAWTTDADHTVSGVILLGYYGTGARPLLQSNTSTGFITIEGSNTFNNVAINGWEFYGYTRDPGNGSFTTAESLNQITALAIFNPGSNLILEDNKVSFCADGLDLEPASNYGNVWNTFIMRRNVIVNNYLAQAGGGGKCQGIFVSGTSNYVLIEENLFDLNGWNPTVANADQNQFSHNFYTSVPGNIPFTYRRNIFARDAGGEQFRQAGIINNNLFLQIAASMACSTGQATFSYNVFQQACDRTGTNAAVFGEGFHVEGVLPGSSSNYDIVSNMSSSATAAPSGAAFGFDVDFQDQNGLLTGTFTNGSNTITNVYNGGVGNFNGVGLEGWPIGTTIGGTSLIPSGATVLSATGFDESGTAGTIVMSKNATNNGTNSYFRVDTVGFAITNLIVFNQLGGVQDNGISTVQTNICNDPSGTNSGQPGEPFPAPTRTISTYSASVGGAGTWQDFLAQCAQQRKANWNTAYTSNAACNYIRAGFNFPQL